MDSPPWATSDPPTAGDWDMLAAQRARALGVGLLSGGYGEDELHEALGEVNASCCAP